MLVCPLCKGAGKEIVVEINPHTKMKVPVVKWCLCWKSKAVSSENEMLRWMGDSYMSLEKVDKKLVFLPHKLMWNPNFLIQNTDFKSFCFHMKSFIMMYRFRDPIPSIFLCKAIDILKQFYVKQEDGTNPRLLDLNKYDLLIFTLDTYQKNDQIATCVAEVVYNRICSCKPTWIYLPEGKSLDNTLETSDPLNSMLKPLSKDKDDNYKKIELKKITSEVEKVKTKVQRNAESFRVK